MTIRLADIDDVPAILEIVNWAALNTAANFAVEPESLEQWRDDWQCMHDRYPWYVAIDGQRISGFAKASPWKGRCAYHWTAETTVYVAPGHHRRGVGKALYDGLLSTLRAQGYRTLLGGITVPNPASVRLHESFGFRRVALLECVGWKFGKWHDVGYWELLLRDDDKAPTDLKPVADAS